MFCFLIENDFYGHIRTNIYFKNNFTVVDLFFYGKIQGWGAGKYFSGSGS